jgi:hypothetical protein
LSVAEGWFSFPQMADFEGHVLHGWGVEEFLQTFWNVFKVVCINTHRRMRLRFL